jgi:hypothetical protein
MPLIKVSEETKRKLDELKIHYRETYDDVVRRLIEFYEAHKS